MINKQCPKCHHNKYTKDGKANGKQRYKCKKCKFRHTVITKSTAATLDIKRQALQLYLEGLGFRSIGRILKFSNVSILRWIRSYGNKLTKLQKQGKAPQEIEIDEMHTYVSKKTQNGYGYLLIELEKNSLILLSEKGIEKQDSNYGIKQKISQ